jgi:single-strand DNA-binding protein
MSSLGLNQVTLIGNVGKDPEIRSTQDGRSIANLTLATTNYWKDKATGERKDKTEWHRIVVFAEGLAETVKNYVKKGTKLYIQGSLQTRKWVDNSGATQYTTEIVLSNINSQMLLLSARGEQENMDRPQNSQGEHSGFSNNVEQSSNNKAKSSNNYDAIIEDDEIPF